MAKSEQPAIYVFRQGSNLVPEMALDAELIGRFSQCDRIKVTLATGRSPPKLRWYWAYLGRIVKATECAPSPEALHDVIKLHTGFVTPVMVKGFAVAIPKSIMSREYSVSQTIGITGEECGTDFEMKMVITFTVQPSEQETRIDPGHEAFVEDVAFRFFRTVRGSEVETVMPPWFEDEFRDADGFDNWLMAEVQSQAEAARDDAADYAYQEMREMRG